MGLWIEFGSINSYNGYCPNFDKFVKSQNNIDLIMSESHDGWATFVSIGGGLGFGAASAIFSGIIGGLKIFV